MSTHDDTVSPTAERELPVYDAHIFVCTNARPDDHPRGSCAGRGAEALLNHLKRKINGLGLAPRVRAQKAGCHERCELGPVLVIYPEGTWYHAKTVEDIDEIVQEHLQNGRPVARLKLRNDQKVLNETALA